MRPAARIAAAIGLLDHILAGEPAERCLTNWARANRYAGSSDRAAIRDHVYQALRCRLSYGWLGGGESGRALMLGAVRAAKGDADEVFSGEGFAPAPLNEAERAFAVLSDAPEHIRCDWPEWAWPLLLPYGDDRPAIAVRMQDRAPVFVRVNLARTTPDAATAALAQDGIVAVAHPLAETALELGEGARRIGQSAAYRDGLVELQDAAPQAAMLALNLRPGETVLDYCAGGGGKALAAAALTRAPVVAHDAIAARMRDLPGRAARAGADIRIVAQRTGIKEHFDRVICDAPCSGSGTWRRDPEGKWALTAERIEALAELQLEILGEASAHVRPGGRLAYMTCSLFQRENSDVVAAFQATHPGWHLASERQFTPLDGGDGFYVAQLTRE